jgi:predicted amidohydrolase
MFKVALAQFKPIRKNITKNIDIVQNLLSGLKADLIVLPELVNSGYLYPARDVLLPYTEASDGHGEFLSALQSIAKSTNSAIVSGYAERYQDRIFNSAAAVSGDEVIANYRKIHLYADEKNLFEPGDLGFSVFEWQGVAIGMMICFDWIFPEAARSLALLGAQIIAHPANLVLPFCQNVMITRSIENKIFTITANRIGQETMGFESLKFTGKSQITGPNGALLYRGPTAKPTVHIMEIDPEQARDKKLNKMNDLFIDRRPEWYIEN